MDEQTTRFLRFEKCDEPVREPVTKLGGQPVWLEEPEWPLSAETGDPMRFIGQVRLPGEQVRLGYIFMTEDDGHGYETMDPEAGENAFFAQPGRPASFYEVAPLKTGPTHGPDHVAVASAPDPAPFVAVNTFLGGTPDVILDVPGTWEHILQLDSYDAPFYVNFGDAGIGHAFLNPESGEGRFFWHCC